MLSHLLNRRAHMLFLGSQFWSWVQTLSDTYIKFIFKFSVFSLFLVLFYKISESWKRLKNGLEFKHVCIHSAYLLLKQSPDRNWELEIFRENTVYETVIGVCVCVCVCMLSCAWLFETPWTVAHHSTLSMEFSRQAYWSGLPFSPPGDPPDPGIETESLSSPALASEFFTTRPPANAPH